VPKSIVLIDGEHYPPVIARAIAAMRDQGEDPVLALLVGGSEKLGDVPLEIGVPVEAPLDPELGLADAIDRTGVRLVIDVSDDPVLSYTERCRLASVALWKGAEYSGPDFTFTPPPRPLKASVPAIGVIGSGKRSGKTAVAGHAARLFRDAGLNPVVVAMGRGGPPEPEILTSDEVLSPELLAKWADAGRHAASDYIEDALTARVPTVGAWRAGGGMAGATAFTNYQAALEQAATLNPGMMILEGSGAAIPPAQWEAGVLVVDAQVNPEAICGYFGLYRLLLADLVVLTMCEEWIGREHLATVEECIRHVPLRPPRVIRTIFRPDPLEDLSGRKIWFGTTAGEEAKDVLRREFENLGAQVIGFSHSLADRNRLRRELEALENVPDIDAFVVELKAAAVDVVTRFGLQAGIEVVYIGNRVETVGGDGPLDESLLELARQAKERFA
jgi:cyclic 2,3-diphosphoglycerate synthetase